MQILFTGASGLLGQYLIPLLKNRDGDGTLYPRLTVHGPSHNEFDIEYPFIKKDLYDLIVHAAAYTDVVGAETNKVDCLETNVIGTFHLAATYGEIPFVFISTEYAHNPVNYYSETKLAAETVIKAYCKNYLIIRTLFKPTPFPHTRAFFDQHTQGDSVDIIAPLICNKIFAWLENGAKSETAYIGTGRKTIISIAKKTRPDVEPMSIREVKGVVLPADYI